MSDTIGIHVVLTTHGTWLHGDPRGSWCGGKLIGSDPFLESAIQARMTNDAVILAAEERRIVADTVTEIVRSCGHRVFAATIQAAHVHLVFAPLSEDVKTAIARLKRRTAAVVLSRRRTRVHDVVPRSLWTEGQFPIFIFDELHLVNAIEYVRDHNRGMGLLADPFDWIKPLYPPGEFIGERLYSSAVRELPPT